MAAKRLPVIEGDIARIPLTKGLEAVVDAADLPLVSRWSWCASQTQGGFYAARNGGSGGDRRRRLMHQDILTLEDAEVDHIDMDKLNNRRSNLRPATRSQQNAHRRLNQNNTSGFKGVCWDKAKGCWMARAQDRFFGYFTDPQDAARAYDTAAVRIYGEFAVTNENLGLIDSVKPHQKGA